MAEDLLNKVFSFISGNDPGGSDKDILLKQVAREFTQNRYAKFFRVKTEELDPSFAQYLYSIYKIMYPVQLFLKDEEQEERLKDLTIAAFMEKAALDLIKRVSSESLVSRKLSTSPSDLSKQLKADLSQLEGAFSGERVVQADRCYNLILALSQFAQFDFSSLIQRFDLSWTPGNFNSQPKFNAAGSQGIGKDLQVFQSCIEALEPQENWQPVLEVLNNAAGTSILGADQWNALLNNLRDLRQSRALEAITRLVTRNPIYDARPHVPESNLCGDWLDKKSGEIRGIIAGIAENQRKAQMSALAGAVFSAVDVVRLHYYTPKRGEMFEMKGLEGFKYAAGLNYLLVFIQDFLQTEMQELCDILLVRGQWTNTASSIAMSEAFHSAVEVAPGILELDETLSEDGSNGPRLRGALLRIDRDKTQGRYINSITGAVDEEALAIINTALQNLITVGKHLKSILEDFQKKPAELIINWKELNLVSKTPIYQRMADDYKKINYFAQLEYLVTHPGEDE